MGSGSESSGPISLLLVGAGRMGQTHLRALGDSQTVAVRAVVDPVAEARASAAETDHGIRTYADIDAALTKQDFDGVLIAAPSTLHRRLVEACAQRGLPMLCEKPCGTNTEDIDAAAHAADQAGVRLQIGYWRRYVPALQDLRQRLQQGSFGELLMVSCWQWDGQPPDASFQASSGGIVIDMAVHEFDLIRWLTGQELSAPASIVPAARAANADPDSTSLLLELSGGAVALISLGRYFPHGDCVWVELMGTRDHARVEVLWGEPGEQVFHAALRSQAEDFASSVRSGEAGTGLGASAADARRTLELAQLATDARSPKYR